MAQGHLNSRIAAGDLEILNDFERGRLRHVLFDFDGTISLLREGWQEIMAPVCIEMIAGDAAPSAEIAAAVHAMIDETTGIQTIYQMQRLAELVRQFGRVPEERILTPEAYKEIYNERLLVPVRERIGRIASGEARPQDFIVHGALAFIEGLRARGATLYVFSGTDAGDVRNEAEVLGVSRHFEEIWGAIPDLEAYSKEKVIREIIARHGLHGPEVMAVGDGPVELRNVKTCGGIALGVASDEKRGRGWDPVKRARLAKAGADMLVPDFTRADALLAHLYGE